MSVSRRIRRQVQRNTRNGLIRSGGFTGRRKLMAKRFLQSRAKRAASTGARAEQPATRDIDETAASAGARAKQPIARDAAETAASAGQ